MKLAERGGGLRHRLSLAGNRTLNKVLHMKLRSLPGSQRSSGGAYHQKKLAEGKSRREATRCLKRRV